jgi:hypothetical protein
MLRLRSHQQSRGLTQYSSTGSTGARLQICNTSPLVRS